MTWCEKVGPYYAHRMHEAPGSQPVADFTSCIFEADSGEASDIWVPFGEQSPAGGTAPPDLMRFGPDLPQCVEQKLIATALGYWFQESKNGSRIMRAWRRTTPQGSIEQESPWVIQSSSNVKTTLAEHQESRLPPAPLPIRSERLVGAIKSVRRRIRARLVL